MKRPALVAGLLLISLGLGLIVVGGIWKVPMDLPWQQWKRAIAPTHLAWMAGVAACLAGLLLVVRDLISAAASADIENRSSDQNSSNPDA